MIKVKIKVNFEKIVFWSTTLAGAMLYSGFLFFALIVLYDNYMDREYAGVLFFSLLVVSFLAIIPKLVYMAIADYSQIKSKE